MEQTITEFVDRIATPIKKMTITELKAREQTWRTLWSWIPDNVKYLVYRIGSPVRILKRDYKGSIGELGEVKFEPSEYELTVYERRYNENDRKFYYETKILKIPQGTVMMLEFILDTELAEEVEVPEVMPLDALFEPGS